MTSRAPAIAPARRSAPDKGAVRSSRSCTAASAASIRAAQPSGLELLHRHAFVALDPGLHALGQRFARTQHAGKPARNWRGGGEVATSASRPCASLAPGRGPTRGHPANGRRRRARAPGGRSRRRGREPIAAGCCGRRRCARGRAGRRAPDRIRPRPGGRRAAATAVHRRPSRGPAGCAACRATGRARCQVVSSPPSKGWRVHDQGSGTALARACRFPGSGVKNNCSASRVASGGRPTMREPQRGTDQACRGRCIEGRCRIGRSRRAHDCAQVDVVGDQPEIDIAVGQCRPQSPQLSRRRTAAGARWGAGAGRSWQSPVR